ncbi:MAG: HlyD family efflux transporter periplasmic adaptor subunit [Planctomycetes bacterium]|nr:HlyD family efflux transporter periplasmic adaptor subunit [Planctomycetota bacterium]
MSATQMPVGATAPLYEVAFSPWIRRGAIVLLALFVLGPALAVFAPWQQNVPGVGRVAAYTPMDRPQSVEAPVKGRVAAVHVSEGQAVEKGDLLLELVDIDPQKLQRIQDKIDANASELAAVQMQIDTYAAQVRTLQDARDLTVQAAGYKIDAAREKLRAAQQSLVGAQAGLGYAEQEVARLEPLVPQFVEELKLLKARAEYDKAAATVEKARADIAEAEANLENAIREQGKAREEANAKIQEVEAKRQEAVGKLQDLQAKSIELRGELRAQQAQDVRAPRSGRVFRLAVNPDGSIVKEGQVLLEIVPLTSQPAVELWVRGVDAPLIEPGRKVRLQFEGWPAIQFVGWPAVAVGTFGGVVALVDPTDSGQGQFRVLILPDPDDQEWPKERWLRQGVRAKGWVLLNEVPLWFELWRQLNGFPPVVALSEPDAQGGGKDTK